MLNTGLNIFVQLPGETSERILHPAQLIELQDGLHTAEVQETSLPLEAGQELLLYFEFEREFYKQPVRIEARSSSVDDIGHPRLVIGFMTTGEAVSAEDRECYRVSTVISDLTTTFGDEERCPLLDVSATGFAVIAAESHQVGRVVQATLQFEGNTFSGPASVQSIKELGDGRIRYGVYSVDPRRDGDELQKGQQVISMAIQRQQLRRLKGTA